MNVFGVPMGGEDRWKTAHLDQENMDYTGMPIAGMRTLESYGESIIEDYYDINKRQTDILNPPISLVSISVETGNRGIASVTPTCSAYYSYDYGLLLPQYTTAVDCHQPNGIWHTSIAEYCEDGTYSTEVNCIEPNGTWSSGSCSDGSYGDQGVCEGAGDCFDSNGIAAAQWNNNESGCLGEGTCTDANYNDNETGCTGSGGTWTTAGNTWTSAGNTWTAGSCSDIGFTDQPTCEAPRSVWHPEIVEHCEEHGTGNWLPEFTNSSRCGNFRGVWNMTSVDAITGDSVIVNGEGIDLDWTITLDDGSGNILLQNGTDILLPTKVEFEVTAETSLGTNTLVIANPEGDFDTYPDPFTVTDQMRIITVYQPDPYVDANGKQGDSLWNRAGYELKNPSNTQLPGDASLNPFGGYHYGSQLYVAPLMNQGVIDTNYQYASSAGRAFFKIYGIGFDPACTVSVQKSSGIDVPGNFVVGGTVGTVYTNTAGESIANNLYVNTLPAPGLLWYYNSSTEITCEVWVDDIPAGHDITLGPAQEYGVMYYDVTVTNPDGTSFTKKAHTEPGNAMFYWYEKLWTTGAPQTFDGIYTDNFGGQPGPNQHNQWTGSPADPMSYTGNYWGGWLTGDYNAGNAVRIWNYELLMRPRIDTREWTTTQGGGNDPVQMTMNGVGFAPNAVVEFCQDINFSTGPIYYPPITPGTQGQFQLVFDNDFGQSAGGSAVSGTYYMRVVNPDDGSTSDYAITQIS
jgi:hypothetical protein